MNTKTPRLPKPILLLLTVFLSSTLFSQTIIKVTDCNLNGWEKQPLPGTTVEFSAAAPKPFLGNGSLRFLHPTGQRIMRARSQHYHNTLLSSLTELRYSTFIESRQNNTDNVLFVLLVDKTGDGILDDYLIFEPRFQTGKWVEGKVPDQGPTINNTWQTWDLLKGIWWFGPVPPRPNPDFGGEYFSFEDYVKQNPSARIFNSQPSGSAGGIRLNAGEAQGGFPYWGGFFEGYADAFTVGINGQTTIHDFEASIADAGADKTIINGTGSTCTTLQATAAGGVAPYSYSWTGGGVTATGQTTQVCPTTNTTYTLTITDANNCSATDEVKVFVNDVSSNAWLTSGNMSTDPAANFIGTTDNVPLTFKVNNQRAGRIEAATSIPMEGTRGNTSFGFQTLQSNTTGSYNTATGSSALGLNTTGGYNTTGGVYALFSNTTGSFNNAQGAAALQDNTTGEYNTASGFGALRHSKTGNLNTSHGFLSGRFTNSSNSTFLGSFATASGDFINATSIGYEATATASNQVRIGNTSVTSIGGQVSWTNFSDGRYKKNLKEDVPGLSFITKLRPLTYTLDVSAIDKSIQSDMQQEIGNNELTSAAAKQKASTGETKATAEKAKIKYTGLVAQEVEAVAREMGYDFSGVDAPKDKKDFYGLRYAEFVVPIIKAVQEQQEQIEQQNEKIKKLEDLVAKLITGEKIKTNETNNTSVTLTGAYLEQSMPNPSNGSATIRYYLPPNSGIARVLITNVKGQILKSINLNIKGTGQVTLDASTLPSGSYTYTLWIDGTQIDAKQMVVVR